MPFKQKQSKQTVGNILASQQQSMDKDLKLREKAIKNREKDVQAKEFELADKIKQLSASHALIASLEQKIKDMESTEHLLKLKLSTSINTDNERTISSPYCKCNCKSNHSSTGQQYHNI